MTAVHHLHGQSSADDEHPRGLAQHGVVFSFRVEKSECIHHDRGTCAFGSQRQLAHIATDQTDVDPEYIPRAVARGSGG